jgi:DNA polymerase III delta prime subunit
MARDRTFSVLIATGVVLAAALAIVANIFTSHPSFIAWINHQPWHSPSRLIAAFLGIVVAIIAVSLWQHRMATSAATSISSVPIPPLDPGLRLQLLDKIQRERVDPRLRQGLRRALRIDLDLTEIPGAVRPKLRVYEMSESGPAAEREVDEPIQDIFEQMAGGRLLILGDPGTGKTNCLLELAGSLIKDAKRDEGRPIPVVLSLPRWTLGKRVRTLGEWLIDDLVSEYSVSRATAKSLLTRNQILPLLDGLDEVSEHRRPACVDAINAFQQERDLGQLAVCCRTAEYDGIPKLDLRTAIRVEKLTRAEVEREIARLRMEAVRHALKEDVELWELIDTPLWLHVLYGAAEVAPSTSSPSNDPRHRLYARYIDYALGRETEGSPRKRTGRESLLHWLGWLAMEMRNRDQSLFAFEDLDASWLPLSQGSKFMRLVVVLQYVMSYGFLVGLVFGLFFWLNSGTLSLIRASIVGLILGLLFGTGTRQEAVEELEFSLRNVTWNPFFIVTIPMALVSALISWWLAHSLATSLLTVVCVVLISELFDALTGRPVGEHSGPNLGTLRSLRWALTFVFVSFALALLVRGVAQSHVLARLVLQSTLRIGGLVALLAALFLGGLFAMQHYTTRLFLWMERLLPLMAVRFLNEATERLFLIRHGGSYEFLHSTFRDYMAEIHGCKAKLR